MEKFHVIDHKLKMVGKLASRKVSKRRLDRAMRAYEKAAGITSSQLADASQKEQTRPE